jgi:hypothetical protein
MAGAIGVIERLVTESGWDAPMVAGPAPIHASNEFAEPAFRTHIWKEYEPLPGGTHVQVDAALQSRPIDQLVPLNTRNLYV